MMSESCNIRRLSDGDPAMYGCSQSRANSIPMLWGCRCFAVNMLYTDDQSSFLTPIEISNIVALLSVHGESHFVLRRSSKTIGQQ